MPRFEVCGFGHGERRRKARKEVAVVLAFGHALRAHETLSRPYALSGFLEVVHRLFEDGVFVGHEKSIRRGGVLRSLDCVAFLTRAPLQAQRGRGSCPWLRRSGLVAPSMSRRTCAATRTVARKASGHFPRRLRVYHFGSSLRASRVLRRLAQGCGQGGCEGRSGAFLKPSFVGLSPPSSAPRCDLSAPAVPPSAARGCPCTVRALRAHLASFRNLPITLRN